MKEIKHNGRFVIDEADKVVVDNRSLADKVEDWLNPNISFRGGNSETNPLLIWQNLTISKDILSQKDIERIMLAINKAKERYAK